VSAFTSRDVDAADRLALARLDDDGAPPVTWPQAGDSHDRDAIRRGRIGQVATSPAPPRTAPVRERRNLMPAPAAPHHGTSGTLQPSSANGSASRTRAAPIPPGGTVSPPSAILGGRPAPRVSFGPALHRHGAVDGGWWPHSRNAPAELPGLIAALDSRPGVRVQRLSVHRDDWDEIPHRLTTDKGHLIRVDWFSVIARHTVSVTTAGRGTIELLVVPPGTADGTAQTAMNMAATGPGGAQAADILTASEAPGRPSA
jgi:hypothetical protein